MSKVATAKMGKIVVTLTLTNQIDAELAELSTPLLTDEIVSRLT